MSEIIKNSKTYDGRSVKIYSCNAGADGMTAAQELANALGVPVKAPIDEICLMNDGNYQVVKERDEHGEMIGGYEIDKGWRILEPRR